MSNPQRNGNALAHLFFLGDPEFDRRIQNFARFFRSHGISVEIWYGSNTETAFTREEGISLVHIPIRHSSGPRRFIEYDRLLRAKVSNAQAANIHFACDLYSLRGAMVRNDNCCLVYDAREIYTELPTVENRRFVKAFWKRRERTGLAATDILVVTAPEDTKAIKKIYGQVPHTAVIRNMPMASTVTVKRADIRNKYGIPSDKKILVYVGGLQQGRGLEVTLRAMQQLKEHAVFVVIGGGILLEPLKELSKQIGVACSVYFLGPIASDEVISLLASCDAGISLIERASKSYELALPSKVFEYIHAGLPVICSPLTQVQDCFAGKDYIFYADENDTDALSQAIKSAFAYGKNSVVAADAEEHFVFEKDAERLLTMIDKIQKR